MKCSNWLIIGILIFLTSCSRSPERILSQIWGVNVREVDLPQEDIDVLVSKGAKPLPLKEPTDTSIWIEETIYG